MKAEELLAKREKNYKPGYFESAVGNIKAGLADTGKLGLRGISNAVGKSATLEDVANWLAQASKNQNQYKTSDKYKGAESYLNPSYWTDPRGFTSDLGYLAGKSEQFLL